tara:strand:- start:208 stop:507 length:300 start_codon:yes stop_codon:yes gene_type:complete
MANKEKELELKVKAEKISEEHLKEVQNSINSVNGLQFNIGKVEVQKHELLHKLTEAQDNITNIQKMLIEEYGSFDVNVETGKINWPSNKEEVEKNSDEK